MKDAILLALADKLERDANPPHVEDGSEAAVIDNAIARGHREAKREFADTLRTLVDMLGD